MSSHTRPVSSARARTTHRTTPTTEPLPYTLIKLGRLLERRLHRALDRQPVSAGQLLALAHIARRPGISRAALARELRISPQATGGLTRQLLDDGLITRTERVPGHPISYSLSDSGIGTLSATAPATQSLNGELAHCVHHTHLLALDRAIRHLLAALSGG